VAQYLSEALDMKPGSDEHLRAILESLDLKRLTEQVNTMLIEALNSQNDVDAA
jgi:hypothetical protein